MDKHYINLQKKLSQLYKQNLKEKSLVELSLFLMSLILDNLMDEYKWFLMISSILCQ